LGSGLGATLADCALVGADNMRVRRTGVPKNPVPIWCALIVRRQARLLNMLVFLEFALFPLKRMP
jgi:hypothetical protein